MGQVSPWGEDITVSVKKVAYAHIERSQRKVAAAVPPGQGGVVVEVDVERTRVAPVVGVRPAQNDTDEKLLAFPANVI